MPATSLQDLFVEELRDMYDGEKRLLRALPKMARAAGSSDLQTAFTTHLRQTEKQVTRLEKVFRAMGEKPRGKKCDGIIGIVEEGNKAIEELDGPVLDAALIAGAQKVEHYEIASYGTLAYFADLLGEDEAKDLLGETLDEEKAADEKLTELAKSDVNRDALLGSGHGEEDSAGMMGTVRRAADSLGIANERSTARRRNTKRPAPRAKRSRK
jgi:ferritin-like metal-binding protein YciE